MLSLDTAKEIVGLMVNTNVFVSDPAALVAVISTLNMPVAVGEPVIAPVLVLTLNPAGRLMAL
jgi:hypothetical protein